MAQIVGGFIMPHDPLITGNPEIADAGQVERVNAAFARVVERVKELLAETDLPLATVAARAGFNYVEYMSVVFKKKIGVPPSDYRAAQRKFAAR